MAPNFFFASMDTASCWVDPLSQWKSSAGFCLSDSAPGLRSSLRPPHPQPHPSPASLAASTRWHSGGVQNNNTAQVGVSAVPRSGQGSGGGAVGAIRPSIFSFCFLNEVVFHFISAFFKRSPGRHLGRVEVRNRKGAALIGSPSETLGDSLGL